MQEPKDPAQQLHELLLAERAALIRVSEGEAQAEAAQRARDEAERRAEQLAPEAETAAARAAQAAAEAERAAAERSAAERDAASWAAQAHRAQRSLEAVRRLARKSSGATSDGEPDVAVDEAAALQAQLQAAHGNRVAAEQRAQEQASIEREAVQRAAGARAVSTRLTAARAQAARTAAEQAQLAQSAQEQADSSRLSLQRIAAERKLAEEAVSEEKWAAATQASLAEPLEVAVPNQPLTAILQREEPAPDTHVTSAGIAPAPSATALKVDSPSEPAADDAERTRSFFGRGTKQRAVKLDVAAPRFGSAAPLADEAPLPAEEKIEGAAARAGRNAEADQGWKNQATLASAEMAAQENLRTRRALARERAERLQQTAAGARSLLDAAERSAPNRWVVGAGAAAVLIAVVGGAGFWFSRHSSRAAVEPLPRAEQTAAIVSAGAPREIAPQPREVTVPAINPPSMPREERPREERPAWLRNAVAAPASDGRPLVAIVIDDMGMDEGLSAQVIALPSPLTISFFPSAPRLARQVEAARASGHELLAHVPMEPTEVGDDPGPNYLGVIHTKDELRARLAWNLNQLQGIIGINNHMGSLFTRSKEGMQLVMKELREREMIFLDSRTSGSSVGAEVAAIEGIPYTARDIFLDDKRDTKSVEDRLDELEALARRKGTAVAVGHPLKPTVEALTRWLAHKNDHYVQVVPVSAVILRQTSSRQARAR